MCWWTFERVGARPCKASFPELAAIHREFSGRGLQIVAVSVDEKTASYAAWVKRFQSPFVVVRDAAHSLVAEAQAPAMPTSCLIDRRGVVRFVHAGFRGDATVTQLRAQITQLLEEKP